MPHIGDVHHPIHLIALVPQKFLQHVLHQVGAQIADMGKMVHRGAAGIQPHFSRLVRDKGLFFHGQCIY